MFTAIVASIPLAFVMVLSLTGGSSPTAAVASLVLALIAIVATISVWTALMIQMNERLEGREPRLGPSVGRALALVFRVAWGVILAYVALVAVTLTAGLIFALIGGALGLVLPGALAAIVVVVLGIALFIFVGVYVFAGFCLFLPGIVVERLTAYRAIKRGFALAQGGQLRILSVVVLSWILIFVPVMAVYFLTGTTSMLIDPEALSSGVVSTGQVVVQQLLAVVASGFTTPFMVACILLLYYDQRVRREAFDLQAEADALAS